MRVEWAGLGLNIRTNVPTVEALRAAVGEILENEKNAIRAKELAEEMAEWVPTGVIAENIDELSQRRGKLPKRNILMMALRNFSSQLYCYRSPLHHCENPTPYLD
jgi:hypothetical protein